MNKIIIDNDHYDLEINEDAFIIINKETNLNFIVKENNNYKIYLLIKNSLVNIKLKLNDNASLIINNLGIDASINYEVVLANNSNLKVVDSILSKVDSINNINIYHRGNNSQTKFYTNGINLENQKLYFNINGIVEKNSLNSIIDENSKIINLKDGDSKIIPNLIIDTKEVIANHSAFIGTFSNSDLYYLMSRGINESEVKKLLIKSLLLSKMENNNEDFIKEIYNNLIGGD